MLWILLFLFSINSFGQFSGLGHSTLTCLDIDGDGYGTGPGCTGPDADDNDLNTHSASNVTTLYGSVNAFLVHKGYQSAGSPLTVWCISTTGNNGTGASSTNADTACANPFLTWSGVSGSISSPYIVIFRSGTYTQSITQPPSGTISVQNIIMSYPGERATIDYSASMGDAVSIAARGYITVDGFKLIGNRDGSGYAGGTFILYNSGSQTITFIGDVLTHCEILNGGGPGGTDSNVDADNLTNFQVIENVIHDVDPSGQHNLYLGSNTVVSTGVIVRRNILYSVNTGVSWANFQFNGRCTGCYFESNLLYNQDKTCMSFLEGVSSSFIRNNLCFNTGYSGVTSSPPISFQFYNYDSGQCEMTGQPSICAWNQTNNVIENNTFYTGTVAPYGGGTLAGYTVVISNNARSGPCPTGGGSPPCGNLGGNFYRNNIIVGPGYVTATDGYPTIVYTDASDNYIASDTWTDNIINMQTGDTHILGVGAGSSFGFHPYNCANFASMALSSTGCSTASPGFMRAIPSSVTASSFDFHLTTGAASVGSGTATSLPTQDLSGYFRNVNAPSLGAYEFGPTWKDLGSGSLPTAAFTANAGMCTGVACTSANYAFHDTGHAKIDAWNSADMAPWINSFVFNGGGHTDNSANDVMLLTFSTNAFTRPYAPSCFNYVSGSSPCPVSSSTADALDDGSPASRHTYNGFNCAWWRLSCYQAGGVVPGGVVVNTAWKLNLATSGTSPTAANWTAGPAHAGGQWQQQTCPVDHATDGMWCLGDGQYLYFYSFASNTWTAKEPNGIFPFAPQNSTGVVDLVHNRMVLVGAPTTTPTVGKVGYLDLTGGDDWAFHDMTSTSAGTCAGWINSLWPGIDIDPNDGKAVGLALNSNTIYVLDLATYQCTSLTASNGPSTSSTANGVMGKFRYAPSVGGFAYINEYNVDSFVFTRNYGSSGIIPTCSSDSQGWAVTGLSTIQNNLIGPLVCYGNNPWVYGDLANNGTVDYMIPIALAEAPALGTVLPGTFSFTSGSDTLTTTANQTGLTGYITCAWNSVDGAGTGRMIVPIASVTPTTVVGQEHFQEPSFSGVSCYRMSQVPDSHGCDFTCWTVENPSQSWNYYDVAIGLYRLYYRTGTTQYQTWAQNFSDIQWQWVLDHGYRTVAPRASSLLSQFFRAGESHAERLPGLYNLVSLYIPLWATNGDLRESGYTLWGAVDGAKVDTNATRHAQYCSWLNTYTPNWNASQNADGSWSENEFALNTSYVSAPKTFTAPFQFQGAPWREAINIKSLEAAYESLNDTTAQGCNNQALATATLGSVAKAVTWQNNFGRSTANRGVYYEVNSQSNDQASVSPATGTVSVSISSTAVTGVGTNWNTAGYCDGTHFIGFFTPRTTYKIASCTSNTAATLSVPFGLYGEVSNVSGDQFGIAPAASTSCNSSATYCFTGTGDRNLTRTNCGGIGWLYSITLNATYRSWADECYSASLGGPTAGLTSAANLNSITLPCSGPACDGLVTDTVSSAENCNDTTPVNTPPCLFGVSFGNLGKNYGEAFGAPGIDNELAWRLLGSQPQPVAPTITSASPLPGGTVGNAYSFQFAANGTLPITWTGTGLPSWASLSSSGALIGTPDAAATSSLSIRATNIAGANNKAFSLTTVNPNIAPTITSTNPLPSGATGIPYSYQFTANGTAPITWSGTSLPAWASLSAAGALTGTPNVAATSIVNITATNSTGSAGPTPFSLPIAQTPPVATCSPKTGVTPPNVLDIQFQTNMALGIVACTNSLTGNGCTVVDVQRIINAALGQACHLGP